MAEFTFSAEYNISDPILQQNLLMIYKSVFAGSEKICAQNQSCYTERDFINALEDQDYLKFILFDTDKPVALMLTTNNLEKARIAYINPECYRAYFPQFTPDKIYYFTFLGVLPEYQRSRAFYEIAYRPVLFMAWRGAVICFDFSHETKARHLPSMIMKVADELKKQGLLSKTLQCVSLGLQEFVALIPNKVNEGKQESLIDEYKQVNAWGISVSIDLQDCNPETIRSCEKIQRFAIEICELIDVRRYGDCIVERFGDQKQIEGYSMVQLIESSLVSGHFAEESNRAFIDVFSCKYFDPNIVAEFCKNFFEAKRIKMHCPLFRK